jgi:hypothetical protein
MLTVLRDNYFMVGGKQSWPKEFTAKFFAKFYLKWQGPNKFSYEVPYFTLMTNTQTKKKFNFHFLLTLQMNAALMFL